MRKPTFCNCENKDADQLILSYARNLMILATIAIFSDQIKMVLSLNKFKSEFLMIMPVSFYKKTSSFDLCSYDFEIFVGDWQRNLW